MLAIKAVRQTKLDEVVEVMAIKHKTHRNYPNHNVTRQTKKLKIKMVSEIVVVIKNMLATSKMLIMMKVCN